MGKRGRPPKYNTAVKMEKRIQHYFDSITRTYPLFDSKLDRYEDEEKKKPIYVQVPRLNNAGEQIYGTEFFDHPSILGMCSHLGMSREALREYSEKPEFVDTIKKAKEKIELHLEGQLYRRDQVTGIIFNLKNNFGWRDRSEIEHTGAGGGPIQYKDVSKLSDDELERRIKELSGVK